VSGRRIAAVSVACVGLVLLAAWALHWPLEKAVLLAPVIVATVGVTIVLFLFWIKVAVDALRRQRHPRRIVAAGVAALAVLVVLSFFVELPRGTY
jgi:predicted acyltransferase